MIRRPPRSTPFPTRRSSDLAGVELVVARLYCWNGHAWCSLLIRAGHRHATGQHTARSPSSPLEHSFRPPHDGVIISRSEEHTSELQSQFHLVCRLLLEKKNH